MIIIQDSQEKYPFDFCFYDGVEDTIVKRIPTGDYTIEGFEDIVAIERKASVDEVANNFGKKSGNWWKEMQRMSKFRHKYIVCEFPLHHITEYPKHSKIPTNKRVKMTSMILSKSINKCISEYGIEVIFCNNKNEAEDKTFQILSEVYNAGKGELF